jgi:hypothetical protein
MRSSDIAVCPCCKSLLFIPELIRVSDLSYKEYQLIVMSGNTKGPVAAGPFDAETQKNPKDDKEIITWQSI